MDNNVDIALKLAELDGGSLSEILSNAKKIYVTNTGSSYGFPFSDADIGFQKVIDNVDITEREKKLIYISTFFNTAWMILHIDWFVYNKTPNEYGKEKLVNVYNMLKYFNLTDTLLTSETRTVTDKQFEKLLKKFI